MRLQTQLTLLLVAALVLPLYSHQHDEHHEHHDHHDHHDHHHDHDSHAVQTYPLTALLTTFFSGFAATLGGLLVVCMGVPSPRTLAHLLSFATGIMLYVSYADLLPHAVDFIDRSSAAAAAAAQHGHHHGHHHDHHDHHEGESGHSHGPGQFYANVCMLAGMLAWGAIALVLPEVGEDHHHHHHHAPQPLPVAKMVEDIASGDAGAQPVGLKQRRRASSSTAARAAALVQAVPPPPAEPAGRRRMIMTGLIAALGVTLHNLPEGIVVYNSTLKGVCDPHAQPAAPGTWQHALGLPADLQQCMGSGAAVAFAIALHNIPEGMAVAAPILAATGSPAQAMGLTVLSSAAEPLAAIVFGYLFNTSLSGVGREAFDSVLWMVNAGVAGVMIALCLGELLPAAFAGAPPKEVLFSNIVGQLVMFASLHFMFKVDVHG